MSLAAKASAKAETDENDADVLDRVIREQALEIVLHQRVQHAQDGAGAAEEEHHAARPPRGRSHQVEHDANEAVHRDLGHHAAHERGHMARRGGMRERQPDVERHKPGLGAGAEQCQGENRRGNGGGELGIANRVERVTAGRTGQETEAQEQRQRAKARHQQGRYNRRARCRAGDGEP